MNVLPDRKIEYFEIDAPEFLAKFVPSKHSLFLQQRLQFQIFQTLSVFIGVVLLFGIPTYILASQNYLAILQGVSGMFFIFMGVNCYFFPENARLYQWIFMILALVFLGYHTILAPMSGVNNYFVILSFIAIVTANRNIDMIIQPMIILLVILTLYISYTIFISNLGVNDIFADIEFSNASILSKGELNILVFNPAIVFSLPILIMNILISQIFVTILGWLIVGLNKRLRLFIGNLWTKFMPRQVIEKFIEQGEYYQQQAGCVLLVQVVDFQRYLQHSQHSVALLNQLMGEWENEISALQGCQTSMVGDNIFYYFPDSLLAINFLQKIKIITQKKSAKEFNEEWALRGVLYFGQEIACIMGKNQLSYNIMGGSGQFCMFAIQRAHAGQCVCDKNAFQQVGNEHPQIANDIIDIPGVGMSHIFICNIDN